MSTTPERIQPNDVLSRHYWSQMCPNFTKCATSDAEGKTCPSCGTELPGFIAEWVTCTACQSRRFYCGPDSKALPGKPDLRCWDCGAPMSY